MNIPNRCEHCAHWQRDESHEGAPAWGNCHLAASNDLAAIRQDSLAVAWDAEGYKAGLWTHETFGCVQWQARPTVFEGVALRHDVFDQFGDVVTRGALGDLAVEVESLEGPPVTATLSPSGYVHLSAASGPGEATTLRAKVRVVQQDENLTYLPTITATIVDQDGNEGEAEALQGTSAADDMVSAYQSGQTITWGNRTVRVTGIVYSVRPE